MTATVSTSPSLSLDVAASRARAKRAPAASQAPQQAQQAAPSAQLDPVLDAALAALQQAQQYVTSRVAERDELVPLLYACLLARQHGLLVGPPGTGKSYSIVELVRTLAGLDLFKHLVTRFSEPDEIVGPLDLAAFKMGVTRRNTKGMLPTAHVAVLEEVFKGSSAILNTLLMMLNEREFTNGATVEACPLISVFAASNEYGTEDTAALYDRLLLRYVVRPLSPTGRAAARAARRVPVLAAPLLDEAALAALHHAADHLVVVPSSVEAALDDALAEIAAKKLAYVSDRRAFAVEDFLRGYALTQSRLRVSERDLLVARHLLWERPEQQQAIVEVLAKRTAPWTLDVQKITAAVEATAAEVAEIGRSAALDVAYATAGRISGHVADLARQLEALASRYPEAKSETDAVLGRTQALLDAADAALDARRKRR